MSKNNKIRYYLVKSLINTSVDYHILHVDKIVDNRLYFTRFNSIINYKIDMDSISRNYITRDNFIEFYNSDTFKECVDYYNMINDTSKYNL